MRNLGFADRLPTKLAFFMSVLIDKSVGPQESGQRTAMQCVISAGGGGGGGAGDGCAGARGGRARVEILAGRQTCR